MLFQATLIYEIGFSTKLFTLGFQRLQIQLANVNGVEPARAARVIQIFFHVGSSVKYYLSGKLHDAATVWQAYLISSAGNERLYRIQLIAPECFQLAQL